MIGRFAEALGRDAVAYRNHVTRMLNYYRWLAKGAADCPQQVLVAGAFHDLGIWTARTFDYLGPSVELARDYLSSAKLEDLFAEVEAIIVWHHKVSPYRGELAPTVGTFRRADLVDVSFGMIRFGVPVSFVRTVKQALPNAGFHQRLIALGARQLLRTPLRPLPMVRW